MLVKKEFYLYFLIVGLVFVVLASLFYFSFFGKKTQPAASPQTSSRPFSPNTVTDDAKNLQYHPDNLTPTQTVNESSQKMLDRDALIGNFITKLPYEGTYLGLKYDYKNNAFTAILSSINRTEANAEFDKFLKDNQIEKRDWLYNLKISYE